MLCFGRYDRAHGSFWGFIALLGKREAGVFVSTGLSFRAEGLSLGLGGECFGPRRFGWNLYMIMRLCLSFWLLGLNTPQLGW